MRSLKGTCQEIQTAKAELYAEQRKRSPNAGKVQRLERLIARLEDWLKKKQHKLERQLQRSPKLSTHHLEPLMAEARTRLAQAEAQGSGKAESYRKQLRTLEQAAARRNGRAKVVRTTLDGLKRTPLPKKNVKRAAKAREEQFSVKDGYHGYITTELACLRCGAPPPCDPAHMRGVDLGGKAVHLLPLCRLCHTWQEEHKREFDAWFSERHGITPIQMASALREAFLLRKRT